MVKKDNKMLYHIAEWLLIVGGLNWLFAIFNINIVTAIFATPMFAGIVYGLVGASAIYLGLHKLNLL